MSEIQKTGTGITIQTKSGLRVIPEIGAKVFNRQTKQHVEVSSERRQWAIDAYRRSMTSMMDLASIFCAFRDQHLYDALGFETFKEFAEECFGHLMGVRQIYYYAAIGARLQNILGSAEAAGLSTETVGGALGTLSLRHWREILTLPDDTILNLGIGEDYIGPDGRSYTLNDLRDMSTGDLREKLRGLSKTVERERAGRETAEAEVAEYQKIQSGSSTVAQELAGRVEQLTGKIEKLERQRLKGDSARTQLGDVRTRLQGDYEILMSYVPKDADGYAERDEAADLAHGLAAEFAGKLARVVGLFVKLEG